MKGRISRSNLRSTGNDTASSIPLKGTSQTIAMNPASIHGNTRVVRPVVVGSSSTAAGPRPLPAAQPNRDGEGGA